MQFPGLSGILASSPLLDFGALVYLLLCPCATSCLASLNWWHLGDVVSASWWFFRSLPWAKAHPGFQSNGCSQTGILVSHLSAPCSSGACVPTPQCPSLRVPHWLQIQGRWWSLERCERLSILISTSSFDLCKQWMRTKHNKAQTCKAESSHWCAREQNSQTYSSMRFHQHFRTNVPAPSLERKPKIIDLFQLNTEWHLFWFYKC